MRANRQMELRILPVETDECGRKVLSSLLLLPNGTSHRFFFAIEEDDYHEVMSRDVGPYLVSQLMHAMRFGGVLRVAGQLDRSLVQNLEAFMRRWILWQPDLFRWVDIVPDEWGEVPVSAVKRHGAISCFSGGVDSFYSYARLEKDHGIPMRSLIFMHGFDIDLAMSNYYEETAKFYQKHLMRNHVKLLKVRSNAYESARKFQLNWGKVGHGIYLAGALHLMGHDHALACIPSSHSPDSPIYPWGSNPVTDPLLSSASLPLIHHDYTVPRYEKIAALAEHDDCLEMIRVCWRITENQLNCGYCSKCMATLLALEVAKPDSWRTAFPKVVDLPSVLRKLDETTINRFQVEQIDIVRHHAALQGRIDYAREIESIVARKSREKTSLRTRLRHWFYDLKLRKQAM